jgi:hypothetical protein
MADVRFEPAAWPPSIRQRNCPCARRYRGSVPQAEVGSVLRSNRQPVTFPDKQRNSWAQ